MKKEEFELTELFAAYSIDNRWFYGIIKGIKDEQDSILWLYSKINIEDGYIIAVHSTRDELSKRLNDIINLVLFMGLNEIKVKTTEILQESIYLN